MFERSRIEAAVCRILGPYLGRSMAKAAVDGHWRILSPDRDVLDTDQLGPLLERLRKGLTLFVGTENAARLKEQLKRELERDVE